MRFRLLRLQQPNQLLSEFPFEELLLAFVRLFEVSSQGVLKLLVDLRPLIILVALERLTRLCDLKQAVVLFKAIRSQLVRKETLDLGSRVHMGSAEEFRTLFELGIL